MNEPNKKLAEFAFGLDNVRLIWGCTDFDTGQFIPNLEACILQATYQNEQALCFNHPENPQWQAVPDFPNDLNACFKWLVPKFPFFLQIRFFPPSEIYKIWDCHLVSENPLGEGKFFEGEGDTAALALCKAVEQLMEKK